MPSGVTANLACLIEEKLERDRRNGINDFQQPTKEVNNQTINVTININSADDVDKIMDSLLNKLPNIGKVELKGTKD